MATGASEHPGWAWLRSIGSPKFHVAPMVDASELAFRLLCRRYGADCTWTPMLHARLFVESEAYRAEHLTTHAADRPLIVQFCANDGATLLAAARLVAGRCDAVNLNLVRLAAIHTRRAAARQCSRSARTLQRTA